MCPWVWHAAASRAEWIENLLKDEQFCLVSVSPACHSLFGLGWLTFLIEGVDVVKRSFLLSSMTRQLHLCVNDVWRLFLIHAFFVCVF